MKFIENQGQPLSSINPGSDEIALTVEDAFHALELLQGSNILVSGGDILSKDNNRLIYAYQLWGEEYIYLNWYYDEKKIVKVSSTMLIEATVLQKKALVLRMKLQNA